MRVESHKINTFNKPITVKWLQKNININTLNFQSKLINQGTNTNIINKHACFRFLRTPIKKINHNFLYTFQNGVVPYRILAAQKCKQKIRWQKISFFYFCRTFFRVLEENYDAASCGEISRHLLNTSLSHERKVWKSRRKKRNINRASAEESSSCDNDFQDHCRPEKEKLSLCKFCQGGK